MFSEALDERSHLLRSRRPPAIGERAARTLLAEGPEAIVFAPEGAGAAESNDLVWSYGRAQWREGDQARTGVYVRAWRADGQSWRIALDHLVAVDAQ